MPKGGFIQFGYWDGLKKGLLAGERLSNDLRRMEAAWYEQNTRRLELTKHVSLAQVDPLALVRLKTTGACDVTLPEWLFDLDHPGHYQRRIKTVSLTVPCIVGPYTSVNATLSLTNHGTRVTEDVAAGYGDPLNPDGAALRQGRRARCRRSPRAPRRTTAACSSCASTTSGCCRSRAPAR